MNEKIIILTTKDLPSGIRLSKYHGDISGSTTKARSVSEFESTMSALEDAIVSNCKKNFPEANAIIDVQINESTMTGTAITIEEDNQTKSFADSINFDTN